LIKFIHERIWAKQYQKKLSLGIKNTKEAYPGEAIPAVQIGIIRCC